MPRSNYIPLSVVLTNQPSARDDNSNFTKSLQNCLDQFDQFDNKQQQIITKLAHKHNQKNTSEA